MRLWRMCFGRSVAKCGPVSLHAFMKTMKNLSMVSRLPKETKITAWPTVGSPARCNSFVFEPKGRYDVIELPFDEKSKTPRVFLWVRDKWHAPKLPPNQKMERVLVCVCVCVCLLRCDRRGASSDDSGSKSFFHAQ